MECSLQLKRKLAFSTYILTLPCIFLACLTPIMFCLPTDVGERVAVGIGSFSGQMLMLLVLMEAAPKTASSTPKLGILYCFNIGMNLVTVILSGLFSFLSRKRSKLGLRQGKKVVLINWLSKLFMVHSKIQKVKQTPTEYEQHYYVTPGIIPEMLDNKENTPNTHDEMFLKVVHKEINTINNKLVDIHEALSNMNDKSGHLSEWQFMVIILNKIFFVIFTVITIILFAVYFP